MYITLNTIKKHLNIATTYTAEDDYLTIIEDAATKAVERTCNVDFEELTEGGTKALPSPLLFACLLIIGDMYANRETTAFASVNKLPTMDYLTANYTDYITVKED